MYGSMCRSTVQAAEAAKLNHTRAAMVRLVSRLPDAPDQDSPSDFVPNCPDRKSCKPSVVAEGSDIIFSATGGRVMINTGECGAVDPCRSKANLAFAGRIRGALEALREA